MKFGMNKLDDDQRFRRLKPANLEAQGRDSGWARDGCGRLVPLDSNVDVLRAALASQPKHPADGGIRVEREPYSHRWLVIDGQNVFGPFDDEKRAHLFVRTIESRR
jgi:hypothetical protein